MYRFLVVTTAIGLAVSSCDLVRWGDDRDVDWESISPAAADMDMAALQQLREGLERHRTRALVIVRRGRIVDEWYASGFDRATRHPTASLAKALAGSMALLVALSDGDLSLDDRAADYIAPWRQDSLKSMITIRHLVTHSSGIPHGKVDDHPIDAKWAREFWARDPDPIEAVVYHAPVVFRPGSAYAYSGPAFAALGYVISDRLSDDPATDLRTILDRRVMSPIGVPDGAWSVGYGQVFRVDGLAVNPLWGGGEYTARAIARVGQLMLNHGRWEGEQLLDSAWVRQVVDHADTPAPSAAVSGHPAPAAGWWTNATGAWSDIPCDAYVGAGAGHRILAVIPSLDLVAVRLGAAMTDSGWGEPAFWRAVERDLLQPLVDAATMHDESVSVGCDAER